MAKILVGVPAMATVATQFAYCLRKLEHGNNSVDYQFIENSLVYDARNNISAAAINGGYDWLLFIDSDMIFDSDLLLRLLATAEAEKADLCTALFFTRKVPIKPSVFSEFYYKQESENVRNPYAERMDDYPKDSVFSIAGCGLAATLISVDALREVWSKYGTPFTPYGGFGEDFSHCIRLNSLGDKKLICDSRIKVGHIGSFVADENLYKMQCNGG